MGIQKITTPSGEIMVVLPLGEYERLSDAADIAMANQVRADIQSGSDELVPREIADRLLEGENSIKVWRQYRGTSARDIASKAGISAAYLSELETGKKQGSLATLKKIAAALDLDLDDIV